MKVKYLLLAGIYQTAILLAQVLPQTPQTPAPDNPLWQPTAELNKVLPKWLTFEGSYRIRFEDLGGVGFKPVSDTHDLGQLRIGLTVKPAAWLSFYAQTQDSRMYWNGPVAKAPPYQNTWDLHQLWGEIGSTEKYHIRVRVGRQELAFGEQRLIGISPWLNSPRVFDAALATFVLNGVQLDSFASAVVNSVDGALDHHKQGDPLYGLYGGLTKLVPKATIEPYVFWRLAPVGYAAAYAAGYKGHLDEKTFGFRFAGLLPAHLDYSIEMARQNGTLGVDSIGAWAGHWNVGRSFDVKWKPRLLGEYNYASGTPNPTGTKISTFDQLYPSGHDKFGVADQVGWRNIRDLRAGAQFKPVAKLNMSAIYHDFWLADARDGLYSSSGAVAVKSLSGAGGTHVGQELDVQGMYKLNKAILFGLGYGHIIPGQFLKFATPGKSYNYPYVTLTYAF